MQRLLALAKLEFKQQLRSPIFWLTLLLSSFLAFDGYYMSPNLWENMHWATDTIILSVLLLALLATMAAGRERRQRVSEIIDSSGTPSWQLILGQWLGLGLLALSISLVVVIVLSIRVVGLGGAFNLSTLLFFWSMVYWPMMLLGATVGLVLGALIPSLFISVPITVGWWFALGNLSATGALSKILPWVWADGLDLTAASTTAAGAAWGFFPFHRFLLNRATQLGIILTLLGVLMLLYRRFRENRLHWQPLLVILLALATTTGSFTAFAAELNAATAGSIARFGYAQLGEAGVVAERAMWQALAEANPTVTALQYSLDLRFDPLVHGLSATAQLILKNESSLPIEQLIFTLDNKMTIELAQWQGKSVDIEESAVFGWRSIALEQALAPDQAGMLELSYSGAVWEWNTRWGDRDPELMSFISSQGIFLPPHLCWYPIPGIQNVVTSAQWFTDLPNHAADFHVTLSGAEQPTLTNLSPQADGSWSGCLPGLLVVAGNWQTTDTENVSLLHTPDRPLGDYLSGLQEIYQLGSEYLGPLPASRITTITVPTWFYGEVNGQDTQTALINERRLNFDPRPSHQLWQRQSMLQKMLDCWYCTLFVTGSDQTGTDQEANNARLVLTSYLWSLYRETLAGHAGSLELEYQARSAAAESRLMPSMDPGLLYSIQSSDSNIDWLQLEETRRADGETALKAALQQLRIAANRSLSVDVVR